MTKVKRPTNTRLNKASRVLTTSERRAFIYQSPRLRTQYGLFYYILVNEPWVDAMENELTRAVEREGLKAAFEQLFGHTHVERTRHGFWVVGSPDDGTRMIFDNMEGAARYAENLHDFYLGEDMGPCPDRGEPMDEEHAKGSTTKPALKLKLVPKKKLPPPPSTSH
jgi:hypothetical protein